MPPEKIKQSLLEAGWNEKDADEAVTILHPHEEKQQEKVQEKVQDKVFEEKFVEDTAEGTQEDTAEDTTGDVPEEAPRSQIVAQRYVQSQLETPPKRVDSLDVTESPSVDTDDEAAVQVAETINQELADKAQATDISERPHTDAPWLEHQVDIYDVTPEERDEMIRTVYRTNEKLSPQTIHALLGIDVDLSEFEESYAKRHADANRITLGQIITITILSVLLALFGFIIGMYYFEVGPFHPSMNL